MEKPVTPSVAWLGFCDGFTHVTEGPPVLWHFHIKGLRRAVVSNIFPLLIWRQRFLLCVYEPRVPQEIRLSFRPKNGGKAIEVTMALAVVRHESSGEATDTMEGSGWMLAGTEFPEGVVINAPGAYSLFQCTSEGDLFLGEVPFLHAPVNPHTAEEIAAIRSDPMAIKSLRIAIECKICQDSFRAYTGLERNPGLEHDGWVWQGDLPDRYKCGCGEQDFSLEYLRTGFHALLARRAVDSSGLGIVRLYERSTLEQQCRAIRELLDSKPPEEDLQKFLERNAIFFFCFHPISKLMVKKPILTRFVCDFAIYSSERKELQLIEIERADTQLLKKDGGVSAELQHALDQVRNWLQVVDDHRSAALDALGLRTDDVSKIQGVVIAGRTPVEGDDARKLRLPEWGRIRLLTYDELTRSVAQLVADLEAV